MGPSTSSGWTGKESGVTVPSTSHPQPVRA